MSIEKIEIVIVSIVVSIQIIFFTSTLIKILTLRTIIPDAKLLKVEGNRIIQDGRGNSIWGKILSSLNKYLDKNKDAVVDFNLIEDIVERNIDTIEEEINLTVGIPLYLGLMATILGIVIALFNMPDLDDLGRNLGIQDTGKALDQGIGTLIDGVKIAMIASFIGLLLTVLNSGVFLRYSKSFLDLRKNDFYTFIQTELMPIVNQDFISILATLQRNLSEFNREFSKLNGEFSGNLSQLTNFFKESTEATKAQKELLDSINKTNVSEIAQYNVKVLGKIDKSFGKLEEFNLYLKNLTLTIENSRGIIDKLNSEFSSNLSQLSGFFDESIRVIRSQKELLDSINETKISEMMKYNVDVLEQISSFVSKLEQLNSYLGNLTSVVKNLEELIKNSGELVNKTNDLLSRTENFKRIAERIENNLSQSQELSRFLSEHFRQLEEHKQYTEKTVVDVGKTVVDVGFSMLDIFKDLEEFVKKTSDSVKEFTVIETNLLRDVLSSSRNGLSNLNHLSTIETKISEFKKESVSQQQINELKQALDEMLDRMNEMIKLLEKIESDGIFRRITAVFTKSKQK